MKIIFKSLILCARPLFNHKLKHSMCTAKSLTYRDGLGMFDHLNREINVDENCVAFNDGM